MDPKELEARLLDLEAKLNKLLEREAGSESMEMLTVEEAPEKITFNVPPDTIPRRVQMDLVLMGGSRPRSELTLDLVLMGGSRPRTE